MDNNNDNLKHDLPSRITNIISKKLPKVTDKELKNKKMISRSFSLMLNLYELLEFGQSKIECYKNIITLDFKNEAILSILVNLLGNYFDHDMFDDEGNPDWSIITKFDKEKRNFVIGIRKYLRDELSKKPSLKDFIIKKDIDSILNNFKELFNDLLKFEENKEGFLDVILNKIGEIINNHAIEQEDLDTIWEYIESIVSFL